MRFTALLFFSGMLYFGKSMGFWYTSLYSHAITIFGLRRIFARLSSYITVHTAAGSAPAAAWPSPTTFGLRDEKPEHLVKAK